MQQILKGKKILLGITGSIAVYKVVDWVRDLRRAGAEVSVIMTEAATRFVAPLTFAALSGKAVHTNMFADHGAETIPHISLARDHDLILVAPATAATISRLANGLADDLLATVALAARVPILVCPAMNTQMYGHPATQSNLDRLRGYGYQVIAPGCGSLACGDEGPGRLPEWENVFEEVVGALTLKDLEGRTVLITAGPTREHLDPVRFLSNRSTGKMGYALARTARRRGARVILVSGPASLAPPCGVEVVMVGSAREMREAVFSHIDGVDVVVKSAAVSDFRPTKVGAHKIKKSDSGKNLELVRNPDILKELGDRKEGSRPFLVGFAAESRALLSEGRRKLADKNLDLMVVNDITAKDAGFGVDTNRVILINRAGSTAKLPLLSKEALSNRIWDRVIEGLGLA